MPKKEIKEEILALQSKHPRSLESGRPGNICSPGVFAVQMRVVPLGVVCFPHLSPAENNQRFVLIIQSGASSRAKHGGAYFSAVYGSIEDPMAKQK